MHDKLKQQHIGSGRLPNIKGHVSITLRRLLTAARWSLALRVTTW